MENEKIIRIKELVEELNRYSYEYYTLDSPTITDKEYDVKYDKLIQLEKETNIILPNSPTQRVGDIILSEFKKVNHKNKLYSQDKAQSFEELENWHNRNVKFVNYYNLPKLEYIVTKKYDGLTLKNDYENNNLILSSSRGNGIIGEDLTEQAKTIINLPKQIPSNDKFSFKGEGLMTKKALKEYNKTAKIPLKNLRNGVGGALRNLDTKETAKRKIIIQFYEMNDYDKNKYNFDTYENQLIFMRDYCNLPVAEYYKCSTIEEVEQAINKIEKDRPNLPYDIDGAVVCINDLKTQEKLGYTIKYPKYSIAYKYEAEETTTTLKDVIWQVGRTLKITPVGIIEPVEINGATVSKVTLNNIDDINKKQLKINSNVFIRRSNDVIPEITGVSEITGFEKEIEIPKICPNCGSKTEIVINKESGKHILKCTNKKCSLVQIINHYCSRNAMNIVGLSKSTIKKFIDSGFINNFQDIYKLSRYKDEILSMDGFGEKSYNKLINNIEKSKTCKLENFIYALGIPNVGLQTAKNMVEFANEYPTYNNESNAEKISLINKNLWVHMKDCGEVLANSIVDYFKNEELLSQYNKLCNILNFEENNTMQKEVFDNPLNGKLVYPTGKFSLKKSELKEKLEKLGCKIANGYSKKLDYLICGGDTSKSGKVVKAKNDGIKLMTEEELMNIINTNK